MKYLIIEYGDNDFGMYVSAALDRLWSNVNYSNGHIQEYRTLAQMIYGLHCGKVLYGIICLLIDAEYMAGDAEHATRGLYWKKVNWKESKIHKPERNITNKYLNISIKFTKDNKFMKKDRNGESAYLNLLTGETTTF